jgi:hypothetical protein
MAIFLIMYNVIIGSNLATVYKKEVQSLFYFEKYNFWFQLLNQLLIQDQVSMNLFEIKLIQEY